jgi:hypothetical protein
MPLNDIHLELYRLERQRWTLPKTDSCASPATERRAGGLRSRLGQALIATGTAIAGPSARQRRVSSPTRPVSAHR